MKRYAVLIAILFMAVGFATVSTTLSHVGSTDISNSLGDYDVYFSDVRVDGVQSLGPIVDQRTLKFLPIEENSRFELEYDVTNSSKNYDAKVNVKCSTTDNVIITNSFDSTPILEAYNTRSGKITVITGSTIDDPITCVITAIPIETETKGEGEIAEQLGNDNIGKLMIIGTEKFNLIDIKDDTYVLLAKYSLGTNNRQIKTTDSSVYGVQFGTVNGWDWTPGPKEIELTTWSTNSVRKINNYLTYIKTELGTSKVTGDLITLAQLKKLGCIIRDDYNWSGKETCSTSPYAFWLINNQFWWTKSAGSEDFRVWVVLTKQYNGILSDDDYRLNYGVRPVITVDKKTYDNYISKNNVVNSQTICESLGYKYGKEYSGNDISENIDGTPLICSNDADYANSCLYTPDGIIMFCK